MKLYIVEVTEDTEFYTEIVVAKNEEEAKERVSQMECWSCIMFINATEIKEVDGFEIKLEKKNIKTD